MITYNRHGLLCFEASVSFTDFKVFLGFYDFFFFTSQFLVTVVLVFDGEAEDVAGPETGAVVHAAVEERMGVGVLDV